MGGKQAIADGKKNPRRWRTRSKKRKRENIGEGARRLQISDHKKGNGQSI